MVLSAQITAGLRPWVFRPASVMAPALVVGIPGAHAPFTNEERQFGVKEMTWSGGSRRRPGKLAVLASLTIAAVWLSPGKKIAPQRYPLGLLWQEAYDHRPPGYPHSSIAAGHQGLAVAEVELRADGSMRHFSVLQAPDEAISKSVYSYVRDFRAGPSRLGQIPLRRGKLLYYFLLAHGAPRVFVLNDLSQRTELLRELRRSGG